jgi:hypothetical protein
MIPCLWLAREFPHKGNQIVLKRRLCLKAALHWPTMPQTAVTLALLSSILDVPVGAKAWEAIPVGFRAWLPIGDTQCALFAPNRM